MLCKVYSLSPYAIALLISFSLAGCSRDPAESPTTANGSTIHSEAGLGAEEIVEATTALTVSNREPRANEVDYNPADGKVMQVNPPGFVWMPEQGAVSYILQCSTTEDFSVVDFERRDIPRNVHCPDRPLKPGEWYWRYAFLTEDGTQAEWSRVRSFSIPRSVVVFPQPPLEELRARISREHPRILMRPETVEKIRNEISMASSTLWDDLVKEAERMMETEMFYDEPAPFETGKRRRDVKEDIDRWRENYRMATLASEHAAHLSFMYRLSGQRNYGERAREWVMAVMSWPPDGTTSYAYNDECAMPILYGISRAYTWANDVFSLEDEMKIRENMRTRGNEVLAHLKRNNHTSSPFESHRNRAWHFMGEAGIAFLNEIPEAEEWLEYAIDVFFNVYPVWGDEDGGWHEGVSYWNSYMTRVVWWLEVMKRSLSIDAYKKPYFSNAGDFALYVNPPGTNRAGFSDMSNRREANRNTPLMRVLATQTQNPYWWWYVEQAPAEDPGRMTYKEAIMAQEPNLKAKEPREIPQSKVFHGVGLASLHSNLADPGEDVHLLFKSSPFGTQSHGYNAQNSFELSAFGIPLLVSSGNRDWHGSPHHVNWMWETFSCNNITVNGQGQLKHSALAKGKIIHEFIDDRLDYIAGDATAAYEGRLNKFIRHVFFVKPATILIVDDLEAPEPATFQYYLHAHSPFTTENQYEMDMKHGAGSLRISFARPAKLQITQESGFQPDSVGFDTEQWHLKAETTEPQTQIQFITLLKPYKSENESHTIVDFSQKDDIEMYGILSDTISMGVILNPNQRRDSIGAIESDSPLLFVAQDLYKNETFAYAVQASYLNVMDKILLETDERTNHFITPEEIGPVQAK